MHFVVDQKASAGEFFVVVVVLFVCLFVCLLDVLLSFESQLKYCGNM